MAHFTFTQTILYLLSIRILTAFKEILRRENILLILVQWFTENLMKGNADKFQTICHICQKTHEAISSFQLNETVFNCGDNITVLTLLTLISR